MRTVFVGMPHALDSFSRGVTAMQGAHQAMMVKRHRAKTCDSPAIIMEVLAVE